MKAPIADFDPLHSNSAAHTHWSTTNAAEAMPGVQTPLGWGLWSRWEVSIRDAFAHAGALPRAEVAIPTDEAERAFSIFFGRIALSMDFMFRMGNMLPGTSGAAVVKQIFDVVPSDFTDSGTKRRYPIIAVRMPATFVSIPRRTRRTRVRVEAWYQPALASIPSLDQGGARRAFVDAAGKLTFAMDTQACAMLCGVQPAFDQLERLVRSAGGPTTELMRGYGSHEETRMVADLWACSRDRLSLDEVVRRHGFHGTQAGELSSVVWRESPASVSAIVDQYKRLPEEADPVRSARQRVTERIELERHLVASLPWQRRAAARSVLAVAHRYMPLRGVCKVSFLQALDVARCAARRYGHHLAAAGHLDHAEDVFFLTDDEVFSGRIEGLRHSVKVRREKWELYRTLDLPAAWQGVPEPVPLTTPDASTAEFQTITGTGSSPGVVEGIIRVVTDPSEAIVEDGDILVARTTDPSWASVMFLASALVVDIGGLLSHAAVVARELGVPCVMGTQIGTQVLRTGDRCRVDGSAGTVEILERKTLPV